MVTETKTTLQDQTVEKLQKLIRVNIDSQEGFQEAAEQVQKEELKILFESVAEERRHFVDELKTYVEWNNEDVDMDGSFVAAVHRSWMKTRGMLSGGDSYAILAEAERGEDEIKKAYEKVLQETAGSAMNDVLMEQYTKVKSAHDRVRDLRDEYKEQL